MSQRIAVDLSIIGAFPTLSPKVEAIEALAPTATSASGS